MDWKIFLEQVSESIISNDDLYAGFTAGENGWLGFPGTIDKEIELQENRLGIKLPPSYKAFLKASNGFKQINSFYWNILPVEKIDWLKNSQQDLYELYSTDTFLEAFVPGDEEYFVYGDKQDCTTFRAEYLIKSLAVSDWGDASLILLNPEVKSGEEWEAWAFATWQLGPVRYKSFEELMLTEYQSYLELLKE